MDFKLLIREHSGFIVGLFQQIALASALENVAVSPISVSVTLAMAAAGAEGSTLDEIISCFRLASPSSLHDFASQVRSVVLADASPKGGPLLSFANGIWVDRYAPLKPSFVNTIHTKYAAVALSVDFQNEAEKAQGEINAWVRSETNETIKEILPPGAVNERTKCVLANALYFKGVWQKQFDASCTIDEDFYLMDGTTVRTQMMTSSKKQEITKFESFKVLRLPYNQGADGKLFSMYFVLPNDKTGLPGLVKTINADFIEQKLVKSKEVKVGSFKLPKFRVSSKFEMPDFLVKLGLSLPFSSQADFSNMVETPMGHSISIGKVYHKAMVEVNEEGTEASAATAAVVLLRSIQFDEKEDFVADHPFLYILKEDMTNIVVFIGHIVNPSMDG